MNSATFILTFALGVVGPASLSAASDQDAIDVCIDAFQASGQASAPGGTVLSSSFSQAGTEVIFEDGDGKGWRCIAYSDGAVGLLEPATPDALERARNAPKASDFQERVQFQSGASGASLSRRMEAGGAFQFILGARAGQTLSVDVMPDGGEMYYIIRNPDGSILLEGTDAGTPFSGQLGQSGDHVVEVVSQTSSETAYDIVFGIE